MRLPLTGPRRDAYVAQVGTDGFVLLDALNRAEAPPDATTLPAVTVLRRVWMRHFEQAQGGPDGERADKGGVRLRPVQGRGPGDRIESPYDTDACFRSKRGRGWSGTMAHLTETCDEGAPHLVVHADTKPANVHEAMQVEAIHAALAAKNLAPTQNLADAAYISADLLVAARERYGIDPVGPQRRNLTWQGMSESAFDAADFAVDWHRRVVRCPEGKESVRWKTFGDVSKAGGRPLMVAGFRHSDCRPCPSRTRYTRSASEGRSVLVRSRPEHEALVAARARERTIEYRRLYGQRQGIEGTVSQGVRAFGLRRARYRGLAKTALQNVATAAAINLDRLAAWLGKRPLAPTRTSRFAALAA